MNATQWMALTKPEIEVTKTGFVFQPNRPQAVCLDGFKISIQASETHYCTPRENGFSYYSEVELGYPSETDGIIMEYAEDKENPTETVYAWVPIEVVDELVEKHGGIVTANEAKDE